VGYEIDVLAVGDGERSGDAIVVRFGNLYGPRNQWFVVVIDGGTKEAGERIVQHIRTRFKTNRVDLVISTHPDGDHSSGLTVVLEEMEVGRLWMHKPWDHSPEIKGWFADGTLSNDDISDTLREELENADELDRIARRKKIPVYEPFSDNGVNQQFPGVIRVLGPTTAYYESLLPQFRDMPDMRESYGGVLGYARGLYEKAAAFVAKVAENWGLETLTDPADDATSAENNSSAIVLFTVDGQYLLFTADAGTPALARAIAAAAAAGIDLKTCAFQLVPHHGSRKNVGPTVLNKLVGPKLPARPAEPKMRVVVSAAVEGEPSHPSAKVTNAYIRRGARVLATQGTNILIPYDAPDRGDYGPASPVPFKNEVEED